MRAPSYRYRLAFHPEERAEIIRLRTQVYRSVGKHQTCDEMEDCFDAGALLVGVWLGDELVASARVLCRPADVEWEHDRFVTWSEVLPPREQCAEVSRFCITRSHRNWHTLRMLCLGIADAMVLTRQHYFLACCTRDLISFYRDFLCGVFVGTEFRHSDLGPKKHYLFFVPFMAGVRGRGISMIRWLPLWPMSTLIALRGGLVGAGRPWPLRIAVELGLTVLVKLTPLWLLYAQRLRRHARRARTDVTCPELSGEHL